MTDDELQARIDVTATKLKDLFGTGARERFKEQAEALQARRAERKRMVGEIHVVVGPEPPAGVNKPRGVW